MSRSTCGCPRRRSTRSSIGLVEADDRPGDAVGGGHAARRGRLSPGPASAPGGYERHARRRLAGARRSASAARPARRASAGSPPKAGSRPGTRTSRTAGPAWGGSPRARRPARPPARWRRACVDAAGRAVGRHGDDGDGVAQVEQLDRAAGAGRTAARTAASRSATPARRLRSYCVAGRGAGLVVGDDQLAVGVELEPVDDAAQAARRRPRPRASARGRWRDRAWGPRAGSSCATSSRGLGVEARPRRRRSRSSPAYSGSSRSSTAASSRQASAASSVRSAGGSTKSRSRAACTRVPLVAAGDGRLGQAVDGREPEGQRAVGERRHLRRAERSGHRERHATEGTPRGVTPTADPRRGLVTSAEFEGGADGGGDAGRVLHRAEVGEVGEPLEAPCGSASAIAGATRAGPRPVAAGRDRDRASAPRRGGRMRWRPPRSRTPGPRPPACTSARRHRRRRRVVAAQAVVDVARRASGRGR